MHYANQAIYSRDRRLVYLSPTAITQRLDQNLECWQLPIERGDEGLSGLLFCVCTQRASIHTEACPPRQLGGFDSMEWEGPPLPRVWYNESELSVHDLERATWNDSSSKQHNKQRWFILYTCSGSRLGGLTGWAGSKAGGHAGVAGSCLFMCDGHQCWQVIYYFVIL